MEQVRILLAIVLSFLVFFLWNLFFVEPVPVQPPPAENGEKLSAAADSPQPTASPAPPTTIATPPQTPAATGDGTHEPSRTILVNTPLYSVRISEAGAVFKSFLLNDYKESIAPDAPRLDMIAQEANPGTVSIGFGDANIRGWKQAVFRADTEAENVTIDGQERSISFTWVSPDGIAVEKRFSFKPDTYLIDLDIRVHNGSNLKIQDELSLSLTKVLPESKQQFGFEGPSARINGSAQQIERDDAKEKDTYTGAVEWLSVQDRYFMSGIIPAEPVETRFRLIWNDADLLESRYFQPMGEIPPGAGKDFRFRLFFGPKSLKILKEYGYHLDQAINFGWFDFIAKPCVWLLNLFYRVIPNYGLAIIFLTLLIKILLWPLGNKSYKSMAEMKKIQPLVNEIREKHKDDKKKMNEEMMKLYRVYKVNPMGGCLPMVLQIPVFFALYRMLYETIELRHAPFIGWINDLSAPDRLFHFGFSIPFMEPPYGIPVLTIIMGASMLLQQKMSPPPGDPAQAKMMMLMPVVFTVIFINFSSGLVLYWLVSNIISMAQQYYVQRKQA